MQSCARARRLPIDTEALTLSFSLANRYGRLDNSALHYPRGDSHAREHRRVRLSRDTLPLVDAHLDFRACQGAGRALVADARLVTTSPDVS